MKNVTTFYKLADEELQEIAQRHAEPVPFSAGILLKELAGDPELTVQFERVLSDFLDEVLSHDCEINGNSVAARALSDVMVRLKLKKGRSFPKGSMPPSNNQWLQLGDIIPFGEVEWYVVDANPDYALLLSVNCVSHSAYGSLGWEKSPIRKFLNGWFLDCFHANEKKRILAIRHGSVLDKVFILSRYEIERYVLGRYGGKFWYWLRVLTPTTYRSDAVSTNGIINTVGYHVENSNGGVRAAMYINNRKNI